MATESLVGVIARKQPLDEQDAIRLSQRLVQILLEIAKRTNIPFVLMSTLSEGPCMLFADTVLHMGQRFEAVVPYVGYAEEFEPGDIRHHYHHLLGRARKVRTLPYSEPNIKTTAGVWKTIIDACHESVFLWDGREGNDISDAYHYAVSLNKKTIVINPLTAEIVQINPPELEEELPVE